MNILSLEKQLKIQDKDSLNNINGGNIINKEENNDLNNNDNKINENEKLKEEISELKVKYLNMQFENEIKIAKYKNKLKNIEQLCNKFGIKVDFNIDNI